MCTVEHLFLMDTINRLSSFRGDSINDVMAETAEMVGFQLAVFKATLTLHEFLYSNIIA